MLGILATILSFVALPLGIVGCSIPYWEYSEIIFNKLHLGLWEYCFKRSFRNSERYICERLGIVYLYLCSSEIKNVRDRAWFVRLYGEIIIDYRPYRRTNHALSHLYHNNQCRPYGVSRAKDWVSVDCGTS